MPLNFKKRNEAIHDDRRAGETFPAIARRFDISDTRARSIHVEQVRLKSRENFGNVRWQDLSISPAGLSKHLATALENALGQATMGQIADQVASGKLTWREARKLPKFGPATWRRLLTWLEAHGVAAPLDTAET